MKDFSAEEFKPLKLKFEKKEKERKEKGGKTEQNYNINDEDGDSSYIQFPDDEENNSIYHSYFLEMTVEKEIEQCKAQGMIEDDVEMNTFESSGERQNIRTIGSSLVG